MQRLKTSNFIGFLATVVVLAFAPIASFASPTETGAVASNGAAFNNPGFDASGNALNKVITSIRGNAPVGVPNFALSKGAGTTNNGISYHSGPVMTDSVTVNIVWYGTWTETQTGLIKTMINNLDENSTRNNLSSYYNINSTYYSNLSGVPTYVKNDIKVGSETSIAIGATVENVQLSTTLNDSQVLLLAKQILKVYPSTSTSTADTITLVLTDGTVSESSGFLTKYCGWHYWETATNFKYSFVGNPKKNLSACAAQTTSPNGDPGVDAMISVIAHEIVEAVTDPLGTGWYDNRGQENADKCAWTFGNTYSVLSNGSKANMNLGGKDFLIQQNWINSNGGSCVLGIKK